MKYMEVKKLNIFGKLENYIIGKEEGIKIYSLGGYQEVGRNCFIAYFEDTDSYIMIDCGVKISREYENYNYHTRGKYLPALHEVNKIWLKLKAIFITHIHLDHCGGLPILYTMMREQHPGYEPPIVSAQSTNEFIKMMFEDERKTIPQLINVSLDKKEKISGVEFKAVAVPHSVAQTRSYIFYFYRKNGIIRKSFLFISDFKFEDSILTRGTKQKFIEFLTREAPVDIMLYDALYKNRKGFTRSEDKIIDGVQQMIKRAPKHLILSFFASNVLRAEQIYNLTKRTHMVEFRGRTMNRLFEIARRGGWFADYDAYHNHLNVLLKPMLIMATGNQAEPYSVLNRISLGEGPFDVRKDYSFGIMADPIPGNEKYLKKMIEKLSRKCPDGYIFISRRMQKQTKVKGKNIIVIDNIHVSGHGSSGDHELLKELALPKKVIEYHHPSRIFRGEIHPD